MILCYLGEVITIFGESKISHESDSPGKMTDNLQNEVSGKKSILCQRMTEDSLYVEINQNIIIAHL